MDILLYLSILPCVLFGFYIYKNDKVEREPLSLLLRCSIGGVIAGIIVIIVSYFLRVNDIDLTNQYGIILYSFIGVAFIEEFFKFIITYLICYKNKEFNYMYDGIVYASFVSIGFAIFENILYIAMYKDIFLAFSRGFLTLPAHIFFAIFMGYYLGIAKHFKRYKKKNKEISNLIKALFIPILLHGFFDYCLFTDSSISLLFFIIFEILLYLASFKKIKDVSDSDKHI